MLLAAELRVYHASTQLAHLYVDICPVVDQELQTECSVRRSCGKVQWGEAFVVGLADVCATVDQLADNSILAIKTG